MFLMHDSSMQNLLPETKDAYAQASHPVPHLILEQILSLLSVHVFFSHDLMPVEGSWGAGFQSLRVRRPFQLRGWGTPRPVLCLCPPPHLGPHLLLAGQTHGVEILSHTSVRLFKTIYFKINHIIF